MTIGEQIKAIRKRKGLTQKALAKKSHVSPQLLNRWERGVRKPKYESISKIANALEIDAYLFYENTSDQKDIEMCNANRLNLNEHANKDAGNYNENQHEEKKFYKYFHQLKEKDKNYVIELMKHLVEQNKR